MPATLDVSCPNCGKQLKVPSELEGKRVKCKECQEVFPVKAPKPAAGKPAAKPAAKPASKPPDPPKPAEKPKNPFLDDDDDDDVPGQGARPMGVIHEDDVARCPHCAQELDPPDADICLNCGFNNKTRVKAETRKVVAADATDWIMHLAPAVIAAVVAIGLVVLDIVCWVSMGGWLEGSFLEKDDKNPVTGATEFWVKPGAFTALIIAVSLAIIIPGTRFAVRRLVFNYKPPEKVKK